MNESSEPPADDVTYESIVSIVVHSPPVWYQLLVELLASEATPLARNTSVFLGDHFSGFVDRQVELGKYASASEVVRAGLRILEEHELQIDALRAALIEGEESGPAEPIDVEAFLAAKRSN